MPAPPRRSTPKFTPTVGTGISYDDLGDRLRLRATDSLDGLATGAFAEPANHAALHLSEFDDPGLAVTGFSFAQFALPVRGGPSRSLDWSPAANLDSPQAAIPLVLRLSDGRIVLLAPLDSWHEQIIAVDQDEDGIVALRWGWHGDLDRVPLGFTSTLGIFEGTSVEELFATWGDLISTGRRKQPRPPARDHPADPVVSHLSYWTDNGAAYWYRSEPGSDLPTSLVDKIDELRSLGIPVRSVELDSWFYPHEVLRPISDHDYPEEVPPTGMMSWTPRPDVVPKGLGDLAQRLANPPLVLHARHISPRSPYLLDGDWWADEAAHPVDSSFFSRWFDDAASCGATCIEQDWMLFTWFGVAGLREAPGRALDWQRTLDAEAGARSMSLLWCMATPADLIAATELDHVVAVRTCDDYRYATDPAFLWRWYLTVNRLADGLGLATFKDCFFSMVDPGTSPIDGDPHAELEALLAAMSAGVVGIGDRIGRSDKRIIDRVCRPDGLLVKPDRPLAIADQSFFSSAVDAELTWATTNSGPWRFVLAIHGSDADEPLTGHFRLDATYLVYDWRREQAELSSEISVTLAERDWALFVCCPVLVDDDDRQRALIGDPSKYATMGATRVATTDDGGNGELLRADGEVGGVLRAWSSDLGLQDHHGQRRPGDGPELLDT